MGPRVTGWRSTRSLSGLTFHTLVLPSGPATTARSGMVTGPACSCSMAAKKPETCSGGTCVTKCTNQCTAGAVQCSGANPRYNSLTLDGVRMNDLFGLNSNGYPTERQPFSYDSIEQVAVDKPEAIVHFDIDPRYGLLDHQALGIGLKLCPGELKKARQIGDLDLKCSEYACRKPAVW